MFELAYSLVGMHMSYHSNIIMIAGKFGRLASASDKKKLADFNLVEG